MAKANKTQAGATEDSAALENELIQGAEGLGNDAPAGNPGHETQSDSTATAEEAAITTEQAPPATGSSIELPKMVEQTSKELPLMVPESQVIMEEDLAAINQGDETKPSSDEDDSAPMYQNDPPDVRPSVLHAERSKSHGADYVVVTKGKQQQVFTRHSWNMIRGTKFGWKEAVPVPPEVRDIRKAKQ